MLRSAHLLLLLAAAWAWGQDPYPPHLIQDVAYSDGSHHEHYSQPILSPGDVSLPVSTTGTSNTEFVSGTAVHLTDGFHAGDHSGEGRFHAYIDGGIGNNEAIALIAPDPTHFIDNVLHVEKWEKFELGAQLPQSYQAAIQHFFDDYYSNTVLQPATPDQLDPVHDLNPYADDSLQVVMTLTKPDGTQTMKWGFYMKQAKWGSEDDLAVIGPAPDDPLDAYRIHFRIAPDMEGTWQYSFSLKAPYTSNSVGSTLLPVNYINYSFVCDPPLPDNKGHLRVNEANRKTLKFETGEPYFGLGVNLADARNQFANYSGYRLRDHKLMKDALAQLHDVGGNFARMWLKEGIFAPEWVNLGVYDHYYAPTPCTTGPGGIPTFIGSGQHQSWCFDQMLDKARESGVYIQLCIDPSYPAISGEVSWGNNAIVRNLVEPSSTTALYDVKEFLYQGGDAANKDTGAFYFWKRKYKYVMARWGYSVNIAALEPFNETDQMLTHREFFTGDDNTGDHYTSSCVEHRFLWEQDTGLPFALNVWLTDIADHVRGPINWNDPVHSPLNEKEKLFIMSYALDDPFRWDRDFYYMPFNNSKLDLMEAHQYMGSSVADAGQPDTWLHFDQKHAKEFWEHFPNMDGLKKPFNTGEFCYSTRMSAGGWEGEIETIFHNYDVSFHNEIWSGAFSGRFATGSTWHWSRVFVWPDAVPALPNDPSDVDFGLNNPLGFSLVLGQPNVLNVGGTPKTIVNRRLHHNFKPLADLLSHPSWQVYNFYDGDYTTNKVYDDTNLNDPSLNVLEAYYLKDVSNMLAIGWIHNRNAWVMNNYYLRSNRQNFLGCVPPSSSLITLTGFAPETPFTITWFSTRTNSTVYPEQMEITSTNSGNIEIDLTAHFGGVSDNYLDTLRSDYAFIITPEPFVKSVQYVADEDQLIVSAWDFSVYPNPVKETLFIRLPDDIPKEINLFDLSGRRVASEFGIVSTVHSIPVGNLAAGMYALHVTDGIHFKTKKIIIH